MNGAIDAQPLAQAERQRQGASALLARTLGVMQITTAALEDAWAIATVHVRSWQAAYADILDPKYLESLSIETRFKRWRDIIERNESSTLVARHEDEVVAFSSYGRCRNDGAAGDEGEIWAIYASPKFWRNGVGRLLLDRSVRELRSLGLKNISLWVLSDNHRAINFYRSFGFHKVEGSEKVFELGGRQVEETSYLLQNDA